MAYSIWFAPTLPDVDSSRRGSQRRSQERTNTPSHTVGESLLRLVFLFLGMLLLLYAVGPEHMRQYAFPLPPALRWLSLACSLGTLPLLIWVHQTLGEHGRRGLHLHPPHVLIMCGPYRWIRHPMCTLLCVFYLSTALGSANGLMLGVSLGIAVALCARIPAEERLLAAHFGRAYADYSQQTGCLLPRLRR